MIEKKLLEQSSDAGLLRTWLIKHEVDGFEPALSRDKI